ncbi:nucleosome assembly protein [Pseudomassariella vexata]|uniref:Nucleosome assembly protein n=1 Tax=Pseudomassariella vexata TaxID=1141098 RepID=A0A1Y2EM14_9PEZI|nr:nucleosome assembly protein [Pseudomassariella vexata]ORY71895.1 nucleosome assembly protein [Pseudomassariella vexata]
MAASAGETAVTYEQLQDLEKDFEEVEVEIIRQQFALTKDLYEKRQQTIAQIPNFWPLVFEQAPPEVDQYIQPSDSALLLSSLTSVSVSRFEIENGGKGDPRSVAIKLEFSENEYFEDRVIEKKFWYRLSKSGYGSLVSEPVPIKWKPGKDLTSGLLDLVMAVWEQEKKKGVSGSGTIREEDFTPEQKALKKKIDNTSLGGMSFFAWFGFRGLRTSAEESKMATEKEKEKQRLRAEGKEVPTHDEDEDEDEEEDDDPMPLEIFTDGEELAVTFSEDLWPGAIKYFTQAQDNDAASDADFEDDEDEDMEDDEAPELVEANAGSPPPSKKRKA